MQTRSSPTHTFDAIVVGSGAGGSAAAYRLVRAGLSVLLIEQGHRLPRDETTLDVQRVVHEGAFKSRERWLDRNGDAFVPEEYSNLGGKTKWYGAALARFRPVEFEPDPDHQCPGWPIGYADLAPYYEEIETLLGIRTFATEPDLERVINRLQRSSSGWRAEPLPMGLAERITASRKEASHFDGFASAAGLKSDGEVALLDRVSASPLLTLSTGRAVTALIGADTAPQRIEGIVLADGARYFAREVVLAAGALHTPRIVQRYIESRGLQGLPVADLVGRHFKLHLLTAVLAISASRKADLLRKTTLLLNEHFPHSSAQPLGFDGELIAGLIPRFVPRSVARVLGERAYGFFLQTEDGSSPDNRVLGPVDARPAPVLDYDARRIPAARVEHRAFVGAFCRDLRRAGYVALSRAIGLHGTAHACGTMRAGSDPSDSVVDSSGRVHGFEGLRVADGSILPRSSRVNPALTIYAWGLRVAELVARSLAARDARPTTVQAEAYARAESRSSNEESAHAARIV